MSENTKIIIVSNRLPLRFLPSKNGDNPIPSDGGISTGVGAIYPKNETHLWIGWPGIVTDNKNQDQKIETILQRERQIPIFLSITDYDNYYNGYCNQVLWPAFHGFDRLISNNSSFWKSYEEINKKFCENIVSEFNHGDTIWIHDFHLMLLPSLLRKKLPNAKIGFFLHTPFPLLEEFRKIPEYQKLIKGILGSNLIGFSTSSYKTNFINLLKYEGYTVDNAGNCIIDNRPIKIGCFPIGINAKKYLNLALSEEVNEEFNKQQKLFNNDNLILSIDRLDYIKGIPNKLKSFGLFLENNIYQVGKVQLLLIVVPSRENIVHYQKIKLEIERLVKKINDDYGQPNWQPIIYNYNSYNLIEISAFYKLADIMLVTSIKDGMNLVSKEFIASKTEDNGVLILSETTGAANELNEAIIVNPNSITEIAKGIEDAIKMTKEEQKRIISTLKKKVHMNDIFNWNQSFLSNLKEQKQ